MNYPVNKWLIVNLNEPEENKGIQCCLFLLHCLSVIRTQSWTYNLIGNQSSWDVLIEDRSWLSEYLISRSQGWSHSVPKNLSEWRNSCGESTGFRVWYNPSLHLGTNTYSSVTLGKWSHFFQPQLPHPCDGNSSTYFVILLSWWSVCKV